MGQNRAKKLKSGGNISMKPDADVALGISMLNSCLEPTVTDQREETMKLMSTADNRQCAKTMKLMSTADNR